MSYNVLAKLLSNPARTRASRSALCVAALLLALSPNFALAQAQGTGVIRGRILDAASGRYLSKVEVVVGDRTIVAYTDDFGEFVLNDVPAGRVTVTANYSGEKPLVTEVEVQPSKTVTQDLFFHAARQEKDGTVVLEEFKVESQRYKSAQQIATAEERFSPTIKNVVSADAFGDIPSGNVGEMVKFIPGIQVEYGNFTNGSQFGNAARDVSRVSVRGFSEADTSITIDGMPVASASPGSLTRTVGLDMLSINNASRVEVIKVATPDMPNNSIGGTINLVTKSAFEYAKPTTTVRVFTQISSDQPLTIGRTGGPDDGYSRKIQPSLEVSTVFPINKKIGITVTGSRIYEYDTQNRIQPLWWYSGRSTGTNAATGEGASTNVPNLITNSAGVGLSYANPYFSRVQLIDTPQQEERYSGNVKVDWKPNEKNTITFNVQYSTYTAVESSRRLDYRVGGGSNGGIANSNMNSTSVVGGGNRNNATGVVTLNNTPLDWGPTFTIGRPAGTITTGNTAAQEVLNAFDKDGATDSEALTYKFRSGGWALDLAGSRSEAVAKFDTTKNGHFSGAAATMRNLGTVKLLDIRDGMLHKVEVYNNQEQLIDTSKLAAWTPDTFQARFGDSRTKDVNSLYRADLRRELDFIPLDFFSNMAVKVGFRRDEKESKKWGSGTSGTKDLSPSAGLTTAQIFSQVVDTRDVRSPGYGLPAQEFIDIYKLYELDKQYNLFAETPTNAVTNYQSWANQQKAITETKDAYYAMIEASWFHHRLNFVGGARKEDVSRVGRAPKTFSNAQYVMLENGARYTDSTYKSGISVISATSPLYAQTAEGAALRAKLDSLKVSYPKAPLLTTTNDNLAYAQRRLQALVPVNAKVSGDPSYTAGFSYEISKKMDVKLSWSRSFGLIDIEDVQNGLLSGNGVFAINDYDSTNVGDGKPGVEQPDGGVTIDGYYGTVGIANPNLKPWTSDNIDVALSYYTDAGGKFGISFFQKWVKNQQAKLYVLPGTEAYDLIEAELGLDKPYLISTSINVPGTQKTHGIELEFKQNLESLGLWGLGRSFTFFGTMTINSLEAAPTIPPQTVVLSTGPTTVAPQQNVIKQKARRFASFGMFFEKGRVNLSVRGVWRERNETANGQLVGISGYYHVYDPAELRMDASVNVRLTKRVSFFGSVRDFTLHKKEQEAYDDKGLAPSYTFLNDRRQYGAIFSLGIRAEL